MQNSSVNLGTLSIERSLLSSETLEISSKEFLNPLVLDGLESYTLEGDGQFGFKFNRFQSSNGWTFVKKLTTETDSA
jgi:hypothetical protein